MQWAEGGSLDDFIDARLGRRTHAFAHPADAALLRAGLQLARRIAGTAPLAAAVGEEVQPGAGVQTDAEWAAWILGDFQGNSHLIGMYWSCDEYISGFSSPSVYLLYA